MKRFLIVLFAFLGAPLVALSVFLFLSLLPHMTLIGWIATSVIITGLSCVAVLFVVFTYSRACQWLNQKQVVRWGVEGAAFIDRRGNLRYHLSAMHEQAKLPLALPAPKEEMESDLTQPPDRQAVLDLAATGMSLLDIAETLETTYYQVQRITSDEKKLAARREKRAKKRELAAD